jgi:hypothetical protein
MTLKEYLKVKFEDDKVALPAHLKAVHFLRNLHDFLNAPIPRSDLMC